MSPTEPRFHELFEEALEKTLQSDEITAVVAARPRDRDPATVARGWLGTIDRRTHSEQDAYRRLLEERQDLQSRLDRYNNANAVLLLLVAALGASFSILEIKLGMASPIVAMILLGVVAAVVALTYPRREEDRERVLAWRASIGIGSWSRADRERLRAADIQVGNAREHLKKALEDAVLARLLADYATASFRVNLETLSPPRLPAGLRESLDTSFHVKTDTGRRLARLICDLNGGSLALVGARGTGKTDLLGALAAGVYEAEGVMPDLTVSISAPVSYVPRDFVLQLFAVTCSATIDLVDRRLREAGLAPAIQEELRGLRTKARDEGEKLLHQQTTSQELSASAALPSATVSGRKSESRSRLLQTYPELVSGMRRFLEAAEAVLAAHRPPRPEGRVTVLVAIDEVDRMETPEQARAFLREVKGVFGVRNCSFVVSMAQETLHSFDAAGKPLYDVLDRTFDEVIHVAYLDLKDCRSLLASRVCPTLPEPFVDLCFCMAGGVARNVIVTARGVVGTALRSKEEERGLAAISAKLVEAEMRDTLNWARASLARIETTGAGTRVRMLDEWVHTGPSDKTLRNRLARIMTLRAVPGDQGATGSICERVVTTAYFLITVLDVFGCEPDQARYELASREEAAAGTFDSLSRTRRRLRRNDLLARQMLDAFREAWQLPAMDLATW
jgi:hypothetical protein